jgi:hypothetical protein
MSKKIYTPCGIHRPSDFVALFHGEGAHTQRLIPVGIISDPERTLLMEETRATTPTLV